MAASNLQLVPPSEAAARAAVIDEFGELKRKEAAYLPTKQRLELLREQIAGWVPVTAPADRPVLFKGHVYTVQGSACQNERRVSSLKKLMKFLGADKFFALVKVGIGALEAELGKDAAATWFVEERTGPRKYTAVLNAPPKEKAA